MAGRVNVGTTMVGARVGRITVPATRYTACIGRETLMRKDGKPRTFQTREAAQRAAQRHIDAQST
ncbi:hypothetical protein PhaeoP66_04644 (plasmid) [Phaeobacter inhibens]|uniref:Uncharacterized protein n=1 Tax=Phaeobacter inhibens TaxID=221822 RepID=A0ABN5GUU9_9RHOB|nr:hypothetical protein [Phaeobacter inhibens]AUQ93832.1 hypothetical protein PhaeoP66_01028 [Phaeobacter inhibens]AUQ97370.1 hypothetical protein PhaeoP66_04644 [Phaeobacter inhibens]